MRKLIVIVFLLSGFSFTKAQEGYRLMQKAEKEIRKENYPKALRLLNSAEKADYGFCGNSYYYALGEIGMLKSQIYNGQKNYDESLEVLDTYFGCDFGVDCEKRDSLRIETLFLKFGKENVVKEFKENLVVKDIIKLKQNDFLHYLIELPTYNYSFEIKHFDSFGFTDEELSNPQELIKELRFYQLMQE